METNKKRNKLKISHIPHTHRHTYLNIHANSVHRTLHGVNCTLYNVHCTYGV